MRGMFRDGTDAIVVWEVTSDGYLATKTQGSDAVLWHPRQVSRLIENLRHLQAVALEGVRWDTA